MVVAVTGGFLLGFLDFVWIKYVPSPLGGLGNSLGVWAVAAFLLTLRTRWSMVRGIAGAVVFLVVAVPSYYVAAALIQHDDWSVLYARSTVVWMVLGVVAGVVFGAGGLVARTPRRRGMVARTPARLRPVALAMPASVLLAEAVIELRRVGAPSYGVSGPIWSAVVLTSAGLLITLLIVRRAAPFSGTTSSA